MGADSLVRAVATPRKQSVPETFQLGRGKLSVSPCRAGEYIGAEKITVRGRVCLRPIDVSTSVLGESTDLSSQDVTLELAVFEPPY